MQMMFLGRQAPVLRFIGIGILLASGTCYAIFTIHWPWMWDTQVFHYAVFLMRHGWVPYKDIYDMNMPGCYLLEQWAMSIFGGGDLGWRFYEFTLLGSMTCAACFIALPYDWAAGLLTGVVFAIFHGIKGPPLSTERDEIITVFVFIGYAFQFAALRKGRPVLMLLVGLSLGMAIAIKPTAVLFLIVLLVFAYFTLKQRAVLPLSYMLWACAGLAIISIRLLIFMLPQSIGPFFSLQRQAIPYYASVAPATWAYLVRNCLPSQFFFFLAAAILLAIASRGRASWEIQSIRAGVILSALSYFVQRKGFLYHRYPFMAFTLLWFAMECSIAIRAKGWVRPFALACTGIAIFVVLPPRVNELRHERDWSDHFTEQLQADLRRVGGSRLQNRVQCLDMVTGCYSALFREGLVQSTGFLGDTAFFNPSHTTSVPYFNQLFWDQMHRNPPLVIILSSERFEAHYSFDKLNAWPQFRDYLNSAYTLDVSRVINIYDGNFLAYRVYLLKQPGQK